ncbi:hypothetical protein FAM14222_000799 [Propionibacterium freudenreichii]|nr:hypothetical protein [Propionibacterium freudenreichii]
MTLRDFLKLTRRRLGTILVCTLLGAVAAAGLLLMTPTTYSAQATAYVRVAMPQTPNGANDSGSYAAAAQLASQKVKAFVSIFTSQSVAESVIKELNLDSTPAELAGRVSASNAANSLTIVVTATGNSPEQARRIADATVTQSAAQVKSLEGANSPVQVVMMAPASLSGITTTPSPVKYLAMGILAGLLLGYALAFIRQHFDTRLRTADDITDRFTDPVLAVLPESRGIARTDAGSNEDFQSAESMRKLRTNLRYANVDHQAKVILVTSPLQGDGKSSVAASLAKVMAIAGDDVILVDTDLRRPSVAATFDLHGPPRTAAGPRRLDQAGERPAPHEDRRPVGAAVLRHSAESLGAARIQPDGGTHPGIVRGSRRHPRCPTDTACDRRCGALLSGRFGPRGRLCWAYQSRTARACRRFHRARGREDLRNRAEPCVIHQALPAALWGRRVRL